MIKLTTLAGQRRGAHHAQIHLPPLTAEEALLISNLLDRAIAALWRTHGDAMADLLACLDPDAAMSIDPDDSVPTPPAPPTDDDIF